METKLVYNVLKENHSEVVAYNIFNHAHLSLDELQKLKKRHPTKESFGERFDNLLRWCFWCKSEGELLISGIHNSSHEKKVDIYYQLQQNFPLLLDYVWSNL